MQHKHKKKRKQIGKLFFLEFFLLKIPNYKPKYFLQSVRIIKTQIVRGRNIITKLNGNKTQTEKKLIFLNIDQTN